MTFISEDVIYIIFNIYDFAHECTVFSMDLDWIGFNYFLGYGFGLGFKNLNGFGSGFGFYFQWIWIWIRIHMCPWIGLDFGFK